MIHIADENQVEKKKDATELISSLNAFQKLLVSKVPKLVKLILTVPATNAVSGRSCSTLRIVKPYLWSSMIQERPGCLILTTYKEKIDKLKLVEAANQFWFQKWASLFHLRTDTSPESLPKVLIRGARH